MTVSLNQSSGKVILAGAGCSDASRLTIRVRNLIQEAPVIFYDDLIDESILDLADPEKLRYVGKRNGHHSMKQPEINEVLAAAAEEFPWVLRLKGGDPFVFGRGMEEKKALEAKGIEVEVEPGLSSCVVIPERAGIPVTDRNTASSFCVVTVNRKHQENGELLTEKASTLAAFNGTIVILMGLSRIREIAEELMKAGKDPKTPAAVLSSANISETEVLTGTLLDIADLCEEKKPEAPAIIVIGASVSFSAKKPEGQNRTEKPVLAAWCGTKRMYERISKNLPEWIELEPVLEAEVIPLGFTDSLTALNDHTETPGWLAFLSENGSKLFLENLKKEHFDLRNLSGWKIACIGKQTARPFEEAGFFPNLTAGRATSDQLAMDLLEQSSPGEVILSFRSQAGNPVFEELLRKAGRNSKRLDLYSVRYEGKKFEPGETKAILFGSPFSAEQWLLNYPETPKEMPVFALSEKTGSGLQKAGFKNIHYPSQISADSLAESLTEFLKLKHKQT